MTAADTLRNLADTIARQRPRSDDEIAWEMAQEQHAEARKDWRESRPPGRREWERAEEGEL